MSSNTSNNIIGYGYLLSYLDMGTFSSFSLLRYKILFHMQTIIKPLERVFTQVKHSLYNYWDNDNPQEQNETEKEKMLVGRVIL